MGGKNRRYISEQFGLERLVLVFKQEKDIISSEGPFTDVDMAVDTMNNLLLQGICSWMVTYNEE